MEVLETFRTEQNRQDKVAELQLLKTSLERQLAGARHEEVSHTLQVLAFIIVAKPYFPILHICSISLKIVIWKAQGVPQ